MNKVIAWTQKDPLSQVKPLLVQFKVEKIVTADIVDVNYLSVFRFPSLGTYKGLIKLAKQESEKAF